MEMRPRALKRELRYKVDEESDPSYGSAPGDRSLSNHLKYGVINLDKPSGPTSHEVVAWVKRILKIDHAGHGGTLDPKVTGVLPVALQKATKVLRTFLIAGKEYVCVMRLHNDVPHETVKHVMDEFVGEIYQKPPLRSSVRRIIRRRRVYYMKDFEFSGRRVLFTIGCQAGTYIRKLVYDVGEALGSGAHMEELRRTRAGPFTENETNRSLYDLKSAYDAWTECGDESKLRRVVQPVEQAVRLLPRVQLRDSAVDSICHGAKLAIPGVATLETGIKVKDTIGLFSLKGELIALATAALSTKEVLKKKHGIVAETNRVVMMLGTYPRLW
jgi:H/ACA ribonucleoprotein complex subunit 4